MESIKRFAVSASILIFGLSGFAVHADVRGELKTRLSAGHHSIGYKQARTELLGGFALEQDRSHYYITEVYCEDRIEVPGPGRIPNNAVLNVEHTWPQSKFGGKDKNSQKSDLHHLYPADSQMNSIRGNNDFGVVKRPDGYIKCQESETGYNENGSRVFTPPPAHRGNVARALFYFAVRYEMRIDPAQEAALRQWNQEDPPNDVERARNDEIEKLQGNRNLFIDDPSLVDQIGDF